MRTKATHSFIFFDSAHTADFWGGAPHPGESLVRGFQNTMPSDLHILFFPPLTYPLMLQLLPSKKDGHQQEEQQDSRDDGEEQGDWSGPRNKIRLQ